VAEDRDWALRHLASLNLPSDLKAFLNDVEAFDAACEVRVAWSKEGRVTRSAHASTL
jgi:hypothetical protein